MKRKSAFRLSHVNKELLLVFSIIAFAVVVNFFVSGQRLVLTFYNLPTLFAVYHFGRRRAVEAALASILFVAWINVMNPSFLGFGLTGAQRVLFSWSDLAIWGGFLLIFAYACGSMYEREKTTLRDLQESYQGVLQILSQIISSDKQMQNHSYRVSVYAMQIAAEMRLPDEQIEDVRAAALLHDIGKLEISRDILYKASRLNDEEMKEMKTHVERGVSILRPLGSSLRRVLEIILAHHDKFDGSGYHPTKGEEIPVEARIISVADVYDALTSDRPYRKALSPFEARDMIAKGAGSDFDPKVVAAFETLFRSQRLEVSEAMV